MMTIIIVLFRVDRVNGEYTELERLGRRPSGLINTGPQAERAAVSSGPALPRTTYSPQAPSPHDTPPTDRAQDQGATLLGACGACWSATCCGNYGGGGKRGVEDCSETPVSVSRTRYCPRPVK